MQEIAENAQVEGRRQHGGQLGSPELQGWDLWTSRWELSRVNKFVLWFITLKQVETAF